LIVSVEPHLTCVGLLFCSYEVGAVPEAITSCGHLEFYDKVRVAAAAAAAHQLMC
jgi:hypothetical protein